MTTFSELPIICLMGPTASGKTDYAIEWALREPVQIISADSALVYRGLDIGTAKPTLEQQAQAPHRLIDICDPSEAYSAGRFRQDALSEIKDIHERGQTPLIVGGTMLYFWVLQNGLAQLPTADSAVREKITEQSIKKGWPALHQELAKIDPQAAARIHPHDGQRIQRALEIYELSGKNMTDWQNQADIKLPYSIKNIILTPDSRDLLRHRIAERTQQLFAKGFIEEVDALRQRPDIHPDLPAMRTVGYRQIWEYLEGQYDLATVKERVFFATCQLAKRQLTWLRRWKSAEKLHL